MARYLFIKGITMTVEYNLPTELDNEKQYELSYAISCTVYVADQTIYAECTGATVEVTFRSDNAVAPIQALIELGDYIELLYHTAAIDESDENEELKESFLTEAYEYRRSSNYLD